MRAEHSIATSRRVREYRLAAVSDRSRQPVRYANQLPFDPLNPGGDI
jgi:hypothetical protein